MKKKNVKLSYNRLAGLSIRGQPTSVEIRKMEQTDVGYGIDVKKMFLDGVIGRRGMTCTASSPWPCRKHYYEVYITMADTYLSIKGEHDGHFF